jgi:hypothetical protein
LRVIGEDRGRQAGSHARDLGSDVALIVLSKQDIASGILTVGAERPGQRGVLTGAVFCEKEALLRS